MKNVHILPTDKPSRLFYNVGGALLFTSYENHNGVNIYITSDEEITEGDWFYDLDTKYIKIKQSWENSHLMFNSKKIILTTDGDLIKDGVQSIDDEFLQWYVKNPSCEEVDYCNWNEYYKITPKEDVLIQSSIDGEVIWGSKQETLEEAGVAYAKTVNLNHTSHMLGFLNGAKWQQERMYSDMQEYAEFCIRCYEKGMPCIIAEDWFEQFKKK